MCYKNRCENDGWLHLLDILRETSGGSNELSIVQWNNTMYTAFIAYTISAQHENIGCKLMPDFTLVVSTLCTPQ